MTDGTSRAISAILLGVAVAASATAIGSGARAGTLTFDSFSPAQKAQFWSRLDKLAVYESSARVCGKGMNVESRFQAAVRDCLTADTLSRVVTTYRQKLSQSTKTADKSSCGKDEAPRILAETRVSADKMVSEAAGMCKACLMTGMCK